MITLSVAPGGGGCLNARAVAIHAKPGFDPCELFFDPKLRFPKLRVARRLIQKKLGFQH